jgi:TolB-like protein
LVSGSEPGNAGEDDRQPLPETVREQLERILASPEFVATDRLRSFLRFVVEEKLAGRADRLKGYAIALEVLGRDATFDPQNDPSVRIEAGKLRRRLERYYLGAGRQDPIRIEIPKGTYAPTFAFHHDVEGAQQATGAPAPPPRRRLSRSGLLGLAGTVAASLIVLTTIWLRPEAPMPELAAGQPAPQQRGPAIIVLPFEDLSENDPGNAFAGGLTEELISNLMRFAELRLYSAYGSFQEEPTADPVELGKRLDVGYVVRGSVRRGPDRVRLIVHLIDARTGEHLWSETYDRALTPENVFAEQEQLAADLAGHLAQPYGIINEVTADSFRRQRPETLFAYDCVLRAFAYRRTQNPELYAASRTCLEEAVSRDPGYAHAWAMLAFAYLDDFRYGYGSRAGDASVLDLTLDTARHATDLDPDSVLGLLALSSVQFYRREFAEADEINRRLLSLNPTNPEVLAQVGWRTAFARNWDEGIALIQLAIDRSIKAPDYYYLIKTLDYYRRSDYRAALAEIDGIATSDFIWVPVVLAAIQAQLGNRAEARHALNRARALNPGVLKNPTAALRVHNVPEDLIDQLIDGLCKAGLEVHAGRDGLPDAEHRPDRARGRGEGQRRHRRVLRASKREASA